MRFEVFKVIPIFEKGRLGNRKRYRVYVGYGDGEGKFGLGVCRAKSEAEATEAAKEAACRSLIKTRKSESVGSLDRKRTGRYGTTIVGLIPVEKGGIIGTEKLPFTKKLLRLAGIKNCSFSCNDEKLIGNICQAFFDALKY